MTGYGRTAWRLIRRWPGPWLVAASALGWALLVIRGAAAPPLDPMPAAAMAASHAGHMGHHDLVDWLAMVAAMSPLLLRSEVAWLWRSNLARRRRAAIALFVAAYVAPWCALAVLWLGLLGGHGLQGLGLLVAMLATLLWHVSPPRRHLLNLCHRRPPMRAFGPGMAIDIVRFGLGSGLSCAGICGPAMLVVMALPGYHLAAMAVVTIIVTIERYRAPRRPAWRLPRVRFHRAPLWRSSTIAAAPSA